MATFLDSYLDKLEKAKNNVESDVLSLLMERESEIRDMIKERWRNGFIYSNNTRDFYYKRKYWVSGDEWYPDFKHKLNPIPGHYVVDLILTGALVESIKTVLKGNNIEIISTNDKYEKIGEQYDFSVYNITEEEENELLDEIMAEVVTNIFNEVWG